MAKWFGKIGYAELKEDPPGVWDEVIVEREAYGDLTKNFSRLKNSGGINDDITLSNDISIIADPYAMNHMHSIRYVTYCDAKWKVESVDASTYPRLVLSLGGVWNGNSPRVTDEA